MTDNSLNLSQVIRKRLTDADKRFWAGDNIADFITEKEKGMLVDELTTKFEGVLDSLIIDRHNDPNSQGTARRRRDRTGVDRNRRRRAVHRSRAVAGWQRSHDHRAVGRSDAGIGASRDVRRAQPFAAFGHTCRFLSEERYPRAPA